MPLQHLVEYFNDRFGREHRSSFRPFILESGRASGIFGPIQISGDFVPLRKALNPAAVVGHTAQIKVSVYESQHLYVNEVENLLANNPVQEIDFESIINFDRLCRTVHMLNYLPLAHLQRVLFLDVDSRHILGIKKDHGAYFEEVITQCGLETKNVVIVMTVNSQYARYYEELAGGLNNYRRRGYQIALKFEHLVQEGDAFELIEKISPDFVSLSARHFESVRDSAMLRKLHQLKLLVASIGGQSILQYVDQKKADLLARNTGFDLVQGIYYESTSINAHFLPQSSTYSNAIGKTTGVDPL